MKVYISKYRDHWISPYTILEKFVYRREIDYDDPVVEKWATRLTPISNFVKKFLDLVHPHIQYVKIDPQDTWDMDHTLAHIILPLLMQLQKTKHGAPFVDDEDVPDNLKNKTLPDDEQDTPSNNHFERWNHVLNEMIFAFQYKVNDSWEDTFDVEGVYDVEGIRLIHNRMDNGFRLFGKYYQNLWD